MILSITLASVVPRLLEDASSENSVGAHLTALATLAVISALILRGSAVIRLWGPVLGIVAGCVVGAAFGLYDVDRILQAQWIGLPSELPEFGFGFGIPFWTLLPAFLFLSVVISIQANGESITLQRVAWREERAVDFRQVHGRIVRRRRDESTGRIRRVRCPASLTRASFRTSRQPASHPGGWVIASAAY